MYTTCHIPNKNRFAVVKNTNKKKTFLHRLCHFHSDYWTRFNLILKSNKWSKSATEATSHFLGVRESRVASSRRAGSPACLRRVRANTVYLRLKRFRSSLAGKARFIAWPVRHLIKCHKSISLQRRCLLNNVRQDAEELKEKRKIKAKKPQRNKTAVCN